MAGISVQFVGIKEVMRAYDNIGIVNWAVCQGKYINFSYSGRDSDESRETLNEWLTMLSNRPGDDGERHTTQAIYVLKFYDDLNGKKITSATPESSAFNFRLVEPSEMRPALSRRGGGYDDLFVEEIRLLRAEVAEMKKESTQVEKLSGTGEEKLETWEKILDHPVTMGLLGKMFGIDMSLMMGDGKLAGVPQDASIETIIDELYKVDPQIKEHLAKLLAIHQNNPGQFKMLLGMLDKM